MSCRDLQLHVEMMLWISVMSNKHHGLAGKLWKLLICLHYHAPNVHQYCLGTYVRRTRQLKVPFTYQNCRNLGHIIFLLRRGTEHCMIVYLQLPSVDRQLGK